VKDSPDDYVSKVFESAAQLDAGEWNALLAQQAQPSPFMRHEYLAALELSGSATARAGWTPRFVTVTRGGALQAGCALYLKDHSYGEYVFDWAWANAYEQHGLDYYPKGVIAVPFTPVPGTRLLARDGAARTALVQAVLAWCRKRKLSSLHLLFGADEDVAACGQAGLMLRHTVQFHWTNRVGSPGRRYGSFDEFLTSLAQEKRKKIRQEQRKVAEAGVTFRWSAGADIGAADWNFFYRCYERTYLEHGNAPYLTRDFFRRMAATMPQHWVLFIAERGGQPIACSLIALSEPPGLASAQERVAYGRYWGALERVDCLHFDACYYQPLQWCIAHGFDRFEGGAQGEHKMARALMPVKTTSAHWLAHPAFADAVEKFLAREGKGIEHYLDHLEQRSPFRQT
jgi:predicted N-acyltransferase